jgi:hypothetical protein
VPVNRRNANATLNWCSCLIQHGLASGLPGQEVFRDNAGAGRRS